MSQKSATQHPQHYLEFSLSLLVSGAALPGAAHTWGHGNGQLITSNIIRAPHLGNIQS